MVKGKKLLQGWSKKSEGHYRIVSLDTKTFDMRYADATITKGVVCSKLVVKMMISSGTRFKFDCNLFTRINVVASVNFTWMTI